MYNVLGIGVGATAPWGMILFLSNNRLINWGGTVFLFLRGVFRPPKMRLRPFPGHFFQAKRLIAIT